MSYMGNSPPNIGAYGVESFNGGGTSFTLSKAATTATVLLFIDGVRQTPGDAYSVSGTTLTTTGTTPSGTDNVTVQFLGDVVDFGEPSDDSVTSAKIVDGAIVNADINSSAAIAKTKLASLDIVNADVNASAAIALSKLASDPSNASNLASGTVPTARLGSGTASSSVFLRGDQSWASAGGTNTPAFIAKFASSGSQTVTDNSTVKVEMSQEVYDSDSAFDPTTNYRWTPGVVGKYLIGFSVYTEDNEIKRATAYLYKNGSSIYVNHKKVILQDQTAVCSPRHTYNGQAIVDVTSTSDYFEVYCWIDTYDGGTAKIQDQEMTYFWGHRLLT